MELSLPLHVTDGAVLRDYLLGTGQTVPTSMAGVTNLTVTGLFSSKLTHGGYTDTLTVGTLTHSGWVH